MGVKRRGVNRNTYLIFIWAYTNSAGVNMFASVIVSITLEFKRAFDNIKFYPWTALNVVNCIMAGIWMCIVACVEMFSKVEALWGSLGCYVPMCRGGLYL